MIIVPIVACRICGKDFKKDLNQIIRSKNRNYCSVKCRREGVKKEKAVLICPVCENKFLVQPGKESLRITCSKECANVWVSLINSGKYNGMWVNGINAYRKNVLKEKEYVCEACGCSNKPLDVHHRDKNRKNNELSNLMLVCKKCHCKLDRKKGVV